MCMCKFSKIDDFGKVIEYNFIEYEMEGGY